MLLIFGYQQVIQKYLNTGNFPIYGIYAIVLDAGLKRENDKGTTYTQLVPSKLVDVMHAFSSPSVA